MWLYGKSETDYQDDLKVALEGREMILPCDFFDVKD